MAAIQQVSTKTVTLRSIMRTAPFMRGHREALEGKPFDYDAYTVINDQWQYERGRQFGLMYRQPIKEGRTVKVSALLAFHGALAENEIF